MVVVRDTAEKTDLVGSYQDGGCPWSVLRLRSGSYQNGGCPVITSLGPAKMVVVQSREEGLRGPRSYQDGGCPGKVANILMSLWQKGGTRSKTFSFVGVFAFTLVFAFFPFSFDHLEVLITLHSTLIMWATFIRKSSFVFGLMLALGLAIFIAFIFPKSLAFAFAKIVIVAFCSVREKCERGITPGT